MTIGKILAGVAVFCAISTGAAAMPLCPDGQRSYFGFCPSGQETSVPSNQPPPASAPPVAAPPTSGPTTYDLDEAFVLLRQHRYAGALPLIKKAAEHGNAHAQGILGRMYINGEEGVPKNDALALSWARKSAEQGDVDGENVYADLLTMGNLYTKAKNIPPPNPAEGFVWWQKAAAQGSPRAEVAVGDAYYFGLVVPRNIEEAIRWYGRAIKQNYGPAFSTLGKLLEDGAGDELPKNVALAANAYQQGADLEDGRCEWYLALLYDRGEGVAKDHAKAIALIKKAAQDGDYHAQDWLKAYPQ